MSTPLTPDEELALMTDFGSAEPEIQSAADLEDDGPAPKKKVRCARALPVYPLEAGPSMADPAWSDFALSQFDETELDPDGRPLVAGLRRVARLLLGPILRSEARVVQAPSLLNGLEKVGWLQPAVVEYTVEILMCRDAPEQTGAYKVTFTDAADVYHGNTDAEFARFATASASTKAEARVLRKALQLKGIAGEEKTVVPAAEAALDGLITPTQVNFIDQLCRRNDVDVKKFISSGKTKYDNIFDVPAGVAALMVEHLAGMENTGKIPPAVKGYNPQWKN